MKSALISAMFTLFSTLHLTAQDKMILDVFENQVLAFNEGDIDQLVDNVSEKFKYFYITSNELILEVEGKVPFRESMESYFSSGRKVTSTIKFYTIVGNRISFKEEVSHLNSEGKRIYSSALGVYEIKDGKITRSWYFIE